MNSAVSHYFWRPLKSLGRMFAFLDKLTVQAASFVLFVVIASSAAYAQLTANTTLVISTSAGIISVIFYVRSYATKNSASRGWNLIMLGNLFGLLFLSLASVWNWRYITMYGTGIGVAFAAGHICLRYLTVKGESTLLGKHHGAIYSAKELGHIFFIVCLLFMAFPISPSFLAQDILLSQVPGNDIFQIVLFCFSYLLLGVSVMRLYTKVFFGPHKTSHHEIAYKSS